MSDIGSDQNYLSIHVALLFALRQYFETVRASVPGVLVFDQISRPYFPTWSEDKAEIAGGEGMEIFRRCVNIDFLFDETARRKGLQVLLIEHVYFVYNLRYVAATCECWARALR